MKLIAESWWLMVVVSVQELTQELEPSGVETVLVDGTASRCDPCQGGLGESKTRNKNINARFTLF